MQLSKKDNNCCSSVFAQILHKKCKKNRNFELLIGRCFMTYLDLLNAFDEWIEQNSISTCQITIKPFSMLLYQCHLTLSLPFVIWILRFSFERSLI